MEDDSPTNETAVEFEIFDRWRSLGAAARESDRGYSELTYAYENIGYGYSEIVALSIKNGWAARLESYDGSKVSLASVDILRRRVEVAKAKRALLVFDIFITALQRIRQEQLEDDEYEITINDLAKLSAVGDKDVNELSERLNAASGSDKPVGEMTIAEMKQLFENGVKNG